MALLLRHLRNKLVCTNLLCFTAIAIGFLTVVGRDEVSEKQELQCLKKVAGAHRDPLSGLCIWKSPVSFEQLVY